MNCRRRRRCLHAYVCICMPAGGGQFKQAGLGLIIRPAYKPKRALRGRVEVDVGAVALTSARWPRAQALRALVVSSTRTYVRTYLAATCTQKWGGGNICTYVTDAYRDRLDYLPTIVNLSICIRKFTKARCAPAPARPATTPTAPATPFRRCPRPA